MCFSSLDIMLSGARISLHYVAIHLWYPFRLTAHYSSTSMLTFSSTQAHEVQFASVRYSPPIVIPLVRCNIEFPTDAKLEYKESDSKFVPKANCEFHGNTLKFDAPFGIHIDGHMMCKFKVTFSDGSGCTCAVQVDHGDSFGYLISTLPTCEECMRITRCLGDGCDGDGHTGDWPCNKDPVVASGCTPAPQLTLTVESS